MKKIFLFLLLGLSMSIPASANEVLTEYTTGSVQVTMTSASTAGQTFQVADDETWETDSVRLKLIRVGTPGTCELKLHPTNGEGEIQYLTVLASATYNCDTVSTSGSWITAFWDVPQTLDHSKRYGVTLRTPNAVTGTKYVRVYSDSPNSTYNNGEYGFNNGFVWIYAKNYTYQFGIDGIKKKWK